MAAKARKTGKTKRSSRKLTLRKETLKDLTPGASARSVKAGRRQNTFTCDGCGLAGGTLSIAGASL